MKEKLLERFIRYVKTDTQSDADSATFPSTKKQFDLANMLLSELQSIGLEDAAIDENGYVTATIPANSNDPVPVIGFIAHMDTSPDMSGTNVNPRIIENYQGQDIELDKTNNIILSVKDFPELLEYKGQTLITTDGTTLLGADDKAGIAEIMTAIEYLVHHPEIKHGAVKIAFTPDEEVGRGVDKFDVAKFSADFAYTIDGGGIGELEYENFNAAHAKITVNGRNIHPGYAKDKMINSMLIAFELNAMLPVNERPEYTTEYEGFFHLIKIDGTVEQTSIQYIIRDHDFNKFEAKKNFIKDVTAFINKKYRENTAVLELKEQYLNMKEKVLPVFHIIENAKKVMEDLEIPPKIIPIRGGTDGSKLSYMGLPCPNIFAGGHNFHGKYEYIPLESMVKATEVILGIIKTYAEQK